MDRVPHGLVSSRSSVCGCFGKAVSVFFTRWAGKPFAWKTSSRVTLLVTGGGVTDSVGPIPHTSHNPSDGFGMVIWMKRYVPFGVSGCSIDQGG